MTDFTFLEPGILADGELEMRVIARNPANPAKGYVPAYEFGLFVGNTQVGRLHLRAQNTPLLQMVGGHIGYNVDEPHRGHHYAERACRLVLPFAKRNGLNEVVLTCKVDNHASIRTIERLGATFAGIVDVPADHEMYSVEHPTRRRYVITL